MSDQFRSASLAAPAARHGELVGVHEIEHGKLIKIVVSFLSGFLS
jgi:hypothetical protein